MAEDSNGRTHEPNLREITAELDGLKDLLFAKMEASQNMLDERDKLYTERDNSRRTAVEAALTAVKEQTKASFDASEKAIVKAEESQKAYNTAHNDLARKMDEQNKATMPRLETQQRFSAIEEKIAAIMEIVNKGTAANRANRDNKDDSRANIALIIAGLSILATIGIWMATKVVK